MYKLYNLRILQDWFCFNGLQMKTKVTVKPLVENVSTNDFQQWTKATQKVWSAVKQTTAVHWLQ